MKERGYIICMAANGTELFCTKDKTTDAIKLPLLAFTNNLDTKGLTFGSPHTPPPLFFFPLDGQN